jgi:hypothetical protein
VREGDSLFWMGCGWKDFLVRICGPKFCRSENAKVPWSIGSSHTTFKNHTTQSLKKERNSEYIRSIDMAGN